jgi:pyruvate/2-oxoglutarate dehydrogenase complex dihydrolipoamide dehydrogenase (E3) component
MLPRDQCTFWLPTRQAAPCTRPGTADDQRTRWFPSRVGEMCTKIAMETQPADLLVIGFGKAGKIVAGAMGRLGKRVVLVERSERMYGGTCPNIGCVPSKGLWHRSNKRRLSDPTQEFYADAVEAVQEIREFMRTGNYDGLNALDTVDIVTGTAAFVDPHTVSVNTGRDRLTISAENILINTGAEPFIPDIPGLRESRHTLTSTELMETTVLPERLAIVGGGYIGIEFAGIYRHFGSQVTLFERGPTLLPLLDDDIAAAAVEILLGDGIEFVARARVLEVREGESGAAVVYEQDGRRHTIEVDTILAATGRTPVTRDLGLDAAGIRTTSDGFVEVDEYLRTSQPHIYAAGDVNGGPQHTYISLDDSRIVLDQLVGTAGRSTADRAAVPRTIFMTPPLATVGLTERQAVEAGYRVRIGSQRVADIISMPRAYAVEETRGLMKFVIDADTDEILGAALLSVDAQELVNTVALAMRHGIKASELRDTIYTHPSSTEAFNDVLGVGLRDAIEAPAESDRLAA